MSLTSHLRDKDSPIRQFLREQFPETRPIMKGCRAALAGTSTLRPGEGFEGAYPYGTVGHALDYRLRYYLGVTPSDELVAAIGARLFSVLLRDLDPREEFDRNWHRGSPKNRSKVLEAPPSERLLQEFFSSLGSTLAEFDPVARRLERVQEEMLARYCYVLALFEQIYRAGPRAAGPLGELDRMPSPSDLLAIAHPICVEDVCQLSWAFYGGFSDLFSKPALLNPDFDGSTGIRGADADLIIDGCLIDIKTSIDPFPQIREGLYQLLGYVLLDYTDRYQFREVGFFLSRQRVLLKWPLEELMETMAGGPVPAPTELRSRFREIVIAAEGDLAARIERLRAEYPISRTHLSAVGESRDGTAARVR